MRGFHPQLLQHFLQHSFPLLGAEPVHSVSDKHSLAALRYDTARCFQLGVGFGHGSGVNGQLCGQFPDGGKLFSRIQESGRHHVQDLVPDLTIHR